MLKCCLQFLFFVFCFGIISSQDIEWVKLNGPNGMTLLDGIYLEKTQELMILTGSFQVYKSKDFGEHWKHIEMNFDSKHSYYNNATDVYSSYFQQERNFKFIYKMPNDSIYFLLDHGLYCFNQMNQLILIDSLCGQYNSYIGEDGYIFRWDRNELIYSNDFTRTYNKINNKVFPGDNILFNDSSILYSMYDNECLVKKLPDFQNQEINIPIDENNNDHIFESNFRHSKQLNSKLRIYFRNYSKLKYSDDNGEHWNSLENEIENGSDPVLFEINGHSLFISKGQYSIKLINDQNWSHYKSKEKYSYIFNVQYINKKGWIIFSSTGVVMINNNHLEKRISIPNNEPWITQLISYSKGHILAKVDNRWQLTNNNGITWKYIESDFLNGNYENISCRKLDSKISYFSNCYHYTNFVSIYDNDFNILFNIAKPDTLKNLAYVFLSENNSRTISLISNDEMLYTTAEAKSWKKFSIPHLTLDGLLINDQDIIFAYGDSSIYYSKNFGKTWSQFSSTRNQLSDKIFCFEKGYLYWTELENIYLDYNAFLYASPDYGKTKILVDSGLHYGICSKDNYYIDHKNDLFLYDSDSIYLKAIQKGVITDQIPIMHNSFYHTPNWVTMGDNGYLYYTSPNCVLQRSKYRYKVNEKGKIIAYE